MTFHRGWLHPEIIFAEFCPDFLFDGLYGQARRESAFGLRKVACMAWHMLLTGSSGTYGCIAAVPSTILTRLKRCRLSSTFLGAAFLGWPRCNAQCVVNLRSTFSRLSGKGPLSDSTARAVGDFVETESHRAPEGCLRFAPRPCRGLNPNPRPAALMVEVRTYTWCSTWYELGKDTFR